MQHSLKEIENFDEELATLDNMRNEWNRSLSPIGQNCHNHHAEALYAISEVFYVKKQLLVECKHLQRQKHILQQLQTELRTLLGVKWCAHQRMGVAKEKRR